MKKNKKAIFYSVTILIFTIFILIGALTAVFKKTSHEKKIGEEQIGLIKEYQKGENILFYIDQSAKYSLHNTIYSLAKRGAYFKDPVCLSSSDGYVMWENVIQNEKTNENEDVRCYPKENNIIINFALFLNNYLNKYLEIYPSSIPKDNYDFNFNEKDNSLEIVGIATQNIMLSEEKQNFVYSLKPSFKIKTSYRFTTLFNEYSNKAQEMRDNTQDCLRKGSYKPNDDDLIACSNINNLKKEIKGIENYKIEIKPITTPMDYTLLFDIKDDYFNTPYSEEELIIKFGLRFLDKFAPPATEIIGIEERTEKEKNNKYLTWKINNASDVVSYDIYTKKIEENTLGGVKIKTEKPTDISRMDKINTIKDKTEWEIKGLEGSYYIYIVATDDAGNTANGAGIEPVEVSI